MAQTAGNFIIECLHTWGSLHGDAGRQPSGGPGGRWRDAAQEKTRVTLADEKDQYGLPVARISYSWCDNDRRLIDHSLDFMKRALSAAGGKDIWHESDDAWHLNGTARMGDNPATSVFNPDCHIWDICNRWTCDGSVVPTVDDANPSLTIQAISLRTADRIKTLAAHCEL